MVLGIKGNGKREDSENTSLIKLEVKGRQILRSIDPYV